MCYNGEVSGRIEKRYQRALKLVFKAKNLTVEQLRKLAIQALIPTAVIVNVVMNPISGFPSSSLSSI